MSGESPEPADTQEDAAEIVHEVKAEETDTPKEEVEEKTEEEGGEEAEAETGQATRFILARPTPLRPSLF